MSITSLRSRLERMERWEAPYRRPYSELEIREALLIHTVDWSDTDFQARCDELASEELFGPMFKRLKAQV